MQAVAFNAGDTIIREGDDGATAYFIVTGEVDVFVGRGEAEKRVGALHAGEVFGEMSLIEPGSRSATVKATTDVECLAASYEEFIGAIEDHPERAVVFMKTLVKRLRLMNEIIAKTDPENGSLREWIQKSLGPCKVDPQVRDLSWTMLW